MPQQTSNTAEKNSGSVQEKSIGELLATGEYEYLGGGLIKRRKIGRKVRDPWHPATEPSKNLNPMHPAPNHTREDVKAFLGPIHEALEGENRRQFRQMAEGQANDARRRKASGGSPRY